MMLHAKDNRNRLLLLCLLLFAACLKQAAETPGPERSMQEPDIAVTYTLAKLNQLVPASGAAPALIDTDLILGVWVRANDRSGNFYNQLVLEDSTGGISLQLDMANLHLVYPEGRKLYIRLKGLYLAANNGLPQLGGTPAPDQAGQLQVSDISPAAARSHIVAGGFPEAPPPIPVPLATISKPDKTLLNRLVLVPDVEFKDPLYDYSYATVTGPASVWLQDCQGNRIALRSSNYASFQPAPLPHGKGSIRAIYTVYRDQPQLQIRDTSDVKMTTTRCDGSSRSNSLLTDIGTLRGLYQGKDTTLGAVAITGTVISDAASRNHGNGNITVQEGQHGLLLFFGSTASDLPALGDSVLIDITGSVLTNYNGMIELKHIRSNRIRVLASNCAVVPRTMTIAALRSRFRDYESTLIRIEKAKLTTGGNYSGNKVLNDGTGTILLYTASSATFAGQAVPAIRKTFQGIVTLYDTVKEIKLRHPDIDVY